jgi:hypothetical protein
VNETGCLPGCGLLDEVGELGRLSRARDDRHFYAGVADPSGGGTGGFEVDNLSCENDVDQPVFVNHLVEADMSDEAGSVAGEALPGAYISPSGFVGADGRSQTRTLLSGEAKFHVLVFHIHGRGLKKRSSGVIDGDDAPAFGVKNQDWNFGTPHTPSFMIEIVL